LSLPKEYIEPDTPHKIKMDSFIIFYFLDFRIEQSHNAIRNTISRNIAIKLAIGSLQKNQRFLSQASDIFGKVEILLKKNYPSKIIKV